MRGTHRRYDANDRWRRRSGGPAARLTPLPLVTSWPETHHTEAAMTFWQTPLGEVLLVPLFFLAVLFGHWN
jgi:hypothetical protein